MQMIPTIDITPLREGDHPQRQQTVAAIPAAAQDIGFLSITGTGVAPETVEAVRNTVRAIFDVPENSKWEQAITRENYRGYIPMGFFTPNDGSGPPDKYEGYKLHHEVAADDPIRDACPLYGPNRWPAEVPEAREVILGYWAQLDGVFHLLLGALAEGLGAGPGGVPGTV
ncbi:oxidoreductase, 2OG-Fe(II) oxygenase family [Rhodobacterales bacterium Y4I]|nr:oxidoreductase, 2OG-Fe(II) oxygenase family [Rhodobacterales bacterium Y4I]